MGVLLVVAVTGCEHQYNQVRASVATLAELKIMLDTRGFVFAGRYRCSRLTRRTLMRQAPAPVTVMDQVATRLCVFLYHSGKNQKTDHCIEQLPQKGNVEYEKTADRGQTNGHYQKIMYF